MPCPLSKYSNLATCTGSSEFSNSLCVHVTVSLCGPKLSYCRLKEHQIHQTQAKDRTVNRSTFLARMLEVEYEFKILSPRR